MKTTIKYTNLDPTPSLETFIDKKLAPFEKLLKHVDLDQQAELHLELARTTRHHHKGLVFKASAQLRVPKKVFRAEQVAADIRTAFDLLKNTLRTAVERHKERVAAKN